MNDQQVIHALGLDDAYHVEQTLASDPGGVTELVTLDGSGLFIRKRIPSKLARRGVWAMLADCDCARLPRVEATYEMPDEFVVVCDFVPGENLEQLVSARGALAEQDAITTTLQLCEAVSALHAHGIIHRDISPTNVVMAADGAHLIDFGIARFRVEGATRDTTQLGTYGFASPEQYGFAQTDARSDVYSLGRLLGYLLTGVSPAEADRYEAALSDETTVRPELAAVLQKASSMEPSARYQSAEELARALRGEGGTGQAERADEAGRGTAVARVTQPGDASGARGQKRRARGLAVAALVVAALVIVVVAAVALHGGSAADGSGAGGSGTAEGSSSGSASQLADPSVDAGAEADVDENENVDEGENEDVLEIVDSGWSVDEQGYVYYGVALRNNADTAIEFPGYVVTGRDETGDVIFSDEQVLSCVGAGETIWWGDLAGTGGHPPAEVEFAPSAVADYQVMTGAEVPAAFEVESARPIEDSLGTLTFVGEVTCVRDDESDADAGGQVALVLVLRDADGKIVYGTSGFAPRPDVGESSSYEIYASSAPAYASYEVYAIPW